MQPPADPNTRPQPLHNPRFRHVSRSAAKRESVQLLGSIKDLQAHFARVGVEHRAGAGAGVRGLGSLGEDEGEEEDSAVDGKHRNAASLGIRPPLAVLNKENVDGGRRERRPWKEVEFQRVDVRAAKAEVRDLSTKLKALWRFDPDHQGDATLDSAAGSDTQSLLITTAEAIRRVRTLALAVSHEQTTRRQVSGSSIPRLAKGANVISTPSRPAQIPRAASYSVTERKSAFPTGLDGTDQLGDLRKAAIEVLATLRKLEEEFRIHADPPAPTGEAALSGHEAEEELVSSEAPDDQANSPLLGESWPSTSSGDEYYTAMTTQRPGSSGSQQVDEGEPDDEEEYNFNALAQAEGESSYRLETWEERIVSEGRTYRQFDQIQPETRPSEREREAVKRWLAVVDGLFGETSTGRSTPQWAAEREWDGRPLARIHNFLMANLSTEMQALLPSPSSESFDRDLLDRLSDGFVLVQAFNSAVMASTKPWGFVSNEDIHDTLSAASTEASSEADAREKARDWTFMRVGNLTAWAAALKLRYNVPLNVISSTPSLLAVPQVPYISTNTSSAESSRSPSPNPRPTGQAGAVPNRPTVLSSAANAPNASLAPPQSRLLAGTGRPKVAPETIDFDTGLVAKRTGPWDVMLAQVLEEWVKRAAQEEVRAASRV